MLMSPMTKTQELQAQEQKSEDKALRFCVYLFLFIFSSFS